MSEKYFYLNRINNECYLVNNLIENSTIIGKIKCQTNFKKYENLSLILENTKPTKKYNIHNGYPYTIKHLSLLKSQLQKNVRRNKKILALKTCISMYYLNDNNKQIGLFEMLRRLTIIILEDAHLTKYYNILVWYLCALSKGYYVDEIDFSLIIDVIWPIFETPFRDSSYRYIKTNIFKFYQFDNLNNNERNILTTMFIRQGFNGMKGDSILLLKCIGIWYERFLLLDKNCIHINIIGSHLPMDLTGLNQDEIMLQAIDFHCSNITNRIKNFINLDTKLIDRMIWDFNSSVNKRLDVSTYLNFKKINKKNYNLWKTIKNIVLLEQIKIKNEI